MKKLIIIIIVLFLLCGLSYFVLGGLPVGYSKNHLIVYKYTCADLCPQMGYWYKQYYGDISYDECLSMGGEPALVGLIVPGPDGKPGPGSIGGYDGCRVK